MIRRWRQDLARGLWAVVFFAAFVLVVLAIRSTVSQTSFVGGAPAGSGSSIVSPSASGGGAGSEFDIITNADVQVLAGSPCFIFGDDVVEPCQANALVTSQAIGLAIAPNGTITDFSTPIVLRNGGTLELTTAQWDAIAGTSGGLVPADSYYVSATTAGHITSSAPTTPGTFVTRIGSALTATKMAIQISVTAAALTPNEFAATATGIIVKLSAVTPATTTGTGPFVQSMTADGSPFAGLATAAAADGGPVIVQSSGVVSGTVAEWDAIVGGSVGLVKGATYYVSQTTAGHLTNANPTTAQIAVAVGVGLNATEMLLQPAFPAVVP